MSLFLGVGWGGNCVYPSGIIVMLEVSKMELPIPETKNTFIDPITSLNQRAKIVDKIMTTQVDK